MRTELIDKLLSTRIPGGSEARDWFLPHEQERGLENVRGVVRLMLEAYLAQQEPVAWRTETGYEQPQYLYHELVPIRGQSDALFLAPPIAIPEGWRPISTAPKDVFLLLAGPSGYTTTPLVYTTGRMCSDYHVGRWISHSNDDLSDWGFEPTHWQPLPPPPGEKK